MNFPSAPVEVTLDLVDCDDIYFQVTRNVRDEKLSSSIREFGIISPPLLLRQGKRYRPVTGFNKLRIVREMGVRGIMACPVDSVAADDFKSYLIGKAFRNELGPMGRLKSVSILEEFFSLDSGEVGNFAMRGLFLPEEFLGDRDLRGGVRGFPQHLSCYLDNRDIHFKTIRKLAMLSGECRAWIGSWIADVNMKVNLFQGIVEMLYDMRNNVSIADDLRKINPMAVDDRKKREDFAYNEVFARRYPEYRACRARADELVGRFAGKKIKVDVPPYFEGDSIRIIIEVRKGEDPAAAAGRLTHIDSGGISELLEML